MKRSWVWRTFVEPSRWEWIDGRWVRVAGKARGGMRDDGGTVEDAASGQDAEPRC